MEWVEVTAKTVEEAKDRALDQLGVDESEAEFEVLQEPKAGLFGRLRSEARVRARVQPTAVRPKVDRGSRRRGRKDRDGDGQSAERAGGAAASADPAGGGSGPRPPSSPASRGPRRANGGGHSPSQPATTKSERRPSSTPVADKGEVMRDAQGPAEDAGEVGEEFLSGLVSAFGVQGSVGRTALDDGDTIELAVEGSDVGMLIGPRGQTLAAIQELTRTVAQRRAGEGQPRIVVDVAGYRKARREALERFTRDVAAQVLASGVVKVLEPMPPADRKVVHDTVNTIDGVATSSEGEEPSRRVVLRPSGEA